MKIKMVVFLGNPGLEYKETRHNAGWLCAENFSNLKYESWQKKFKGLFTTQIINNEKIIFLKPETFMNKSGESVHAASMFFKMAVEEILVVHDDLEEKFGIIALKKGGGLAGNNGLKSIANQIGSKDFYRLKIGIGRPLHGSVSSWVTGRFSKEEEIHLGIILEKSAELLNQCLNSCAEVQKTTVIQ